MRSATIHASDAGFTLVETLVVLSILALLATLVLPSFLGRREPTASATAQQITSLLQMARINAVARGRREEVTVHVGDGTVRYGAGQVIHIPRSLDRQLLVGRELVAATGATATILFLPDGGSSGAELTLSERAGGHTVISVAWLTGVPSVREVP